jgi:ATPase subunit of ABC transporter with duplicated ATPase domains
MPFVGAERLGFAYSDRVCLFEDVHFRLAPGWHGLVGANGLGKTTLARLIAGELQPTSGRIWLEPETAGVVICRQEIDQLSDAVQAFAQSNDRESCRQRGQLQLEPASVKRWTTLSPGERKRWQIGAALAAEPDVLILDEPTNHLDSSGREHLMLALRSFGGVGIAISHDRGLLARLTEATLRIQGCVVESYAASYAEARQLWQASEARAREVRSELVQNVRRLEQRIGVTRREQQAAQKQRSAGARMKNVHDHDGSSFARTGRAANGEARISRHLSVMATELEHRRENVPEFTVDKTLGRSLFLGYRPAPMPRILGIDGEDLFAGDRLLLRDVRVSLGREARVHLKGPNGAGKTTLIQTLLARTTPTDHLLYLPQDLSPEQIREVQKAARGLPNTERGRIMSILAAFGVDPESILLTPMPSPGEARKLKLAFGLSAHAWALILDEPTNHLDLPSIERLERALSAYPGALLMVSHDSQFAESCTNQIWQIEGQRLIVK